MTTKSPSGATGFTKPPILGVGVTVARAVLVILTVLAWVTAVRDRLHPAVVAAVPIVAAVAAFITIYHVALTHWLLRWWAWVRRRRSPHLTAPLPAREVILGDAAIGVVTENEHLVTLIDLCSDPLAPAVVSETEERTVNTLSIAELAAIIDGVLDVNVSEADFLCNGFRAAGGFAAHYQQIIGPTVGPAERHGWIVVRVGLYDNLPAIDRRGGDTAAAERMAAATCLRIADTLASSGIDARPCNAREVDDLNAVLHAEVPNADHWAYLENRNGYAGVYYADPTHLDQDAAQWWTWPQSREVTTLVRLTPQPDGPTTVAALVRYRTDAPTTAPPVSRLGPLYGVQSAMWQQFRVGYLPVEAPVPAAPLAGADPALPFGPAGPLIGSIGDPLDHTSVHLPLSGPITVLCQTSLLLRQVTLRATTMGRPVVVITDEPDKWKPIVAQAVTGEVLNDYPPGWVTAEEETANEVADSHDGADDVDDAAPPVPSAAEPRNLDPRTVLVIDTDREWPDQLPELTILTNDEACDADIELVDTDEQFGFTLKIRTGLSARIPSMPAHEERRILGVNPPPASPRAAARRVEPPAPSQPRPPAPVPSPAAKVSTSTNEDAATRSGAQTPAGRPEQPAPRRRVVIPPDVLGPRPQPAPPAGPDQSAPARPPRVPVRPPGTSLPHNDIPRSAPPAEPGAPRQTPEQARPRFAWPRDEPPRPTPPPGSRSGPGGPRPPRPPAFHTDTAQPNPPIPGRHRAPDTANPSGQADTDNGQPGNTATPAPPEARTTADHEDR